MAMAAIRLCLVFGVTWFASASSARAGDDQMAAAYGLGVHAYFNGQSAEASELLTQSIGAGTADPRPYFFRGVVRHGLGDAQAALDDFRTGARLEYAKSGQAFDVAAALERVQGPVRVEIESCRRTAWAEARAKRTAHRRLDQSLGNAANRSDVAIDSSSLPDVSALSDPTIPFPDTSAKAYYPPVKAAPAPGTIVIPEEAMTTPSAPADDPFSGGAPSKPKQPQPPAEDSDPFGGDAAPPPAKDAPKPDDDPFGGG
jgi:hypothetical protein